MGKLQTQSVAAKYLSSGHFHYMSIHTIYDTQTAAVVSVALLKIYVTLQSF